MEDIINETAQGFYELICKIANERGYESKEISGSLAIDIVVNTGNRVIRPFLSVDTKNECVRFSCYLNCLFPSQKHLDASVACSAVTMGVQYGAFDFNCNDNSVLFRAAVPYGSSQISRSAIEQMIDYSIATVDAYEQDFVDLKFGKITLEKFLEKF